MKIFQAVPLAMLLMLGACAKHSPTADSAGDAGKPVEKPVASVNDMPISRALFDTYVKYTQNKAASELTVEQRDQLLDNLVRDELVTQQAEKAGLEKGRDTAALLAFSRLQILDQAQYDLYLKDKKPTDAEVQTEYDAQVAAMPKTQYHARHILVKTQAEAQQIIDELKKGAKFEDLAKQDSIDSTKAEGGDLGWFSPANMVPPFVAAVAALKKGEVTQAPVQTQYGWHVIQLLDTREAPVPPLPQVKDRVVQIVMSKKVRAYQDELLKSAKVDKTL